MTRPYSTVPLVLALALAASCASDSAEVEVEVTETNVDRLPEPGYEALDCPNLSYSVFGSRDCEDVSDDYAMLICSDEELCDAVLDRLQAEVEACENESFRYVIDVDLDC